MSLPLVVVLGLCLAQSSGAGFSLSRAASGSQGSLSPLSGDSDLPGDEDSEAEFQRAVLANVQSASTYEEPLLPGPPGKFVRDFLYNGPLHKLPVVGFWYGPGKPYNGTADERNASNKYMEHVRDRLKKTPAQGGVSPIEIPDDLPSNKRLAWREFGLETVSKKNYIESRLSDVEAALRSAPSGAGFARPRTDVNPELDFPWWMDAEAFPWLLDASDHASSLSPPLDLLDLEATVEVRIKTSLSEAQPDPLKEAVTRAAKDSWEHGSGKLVVKPGKGDASENVFILEPEGNHRRQYIIDHWSSSGAATTMIVAPDEDQWSVHSLGTSPPKILASSHGFDFSGAVAHVSETVLASVRTRNERGETEQVPLHPPMMLVQHHVGFRMPGEIWADIVPEIKIFWWKGLPLLATFPPVALARGVVWRRDFSTAALQDNPAELDEVNWDGNGLAYPHRTGFRPVSDQWRISVMPDA